MRFMIMTWVGDAAQALSIFGVIDEEGSGKLPALSPHGHWAEFRVIDEAQFKFAEEAKACIGKDGYYLMGAGVTTREAFGDGQ
jgi:hypothetical protein